MILISNSTKRNDLGVKVFFRNLTFEKKKLSMYGFRKKNMIYFYSESIKNEIIDFLGDIVLIIKCWLKY